MEIQMPVSSRYDDKIIVIELSGEYSPEEARTVIYNAFMDPSRPKDAVLLMDLTQSKSISRRSSENILALADYINSFKEYYHNRIALVAPDDLKFGLMRMSTPAGERLGIEIIVFREYSQARDWLLSA